MDDIQELLGKIMSDPQAMNQLESMGKMLGLDTSQNGGTNNNRTAHQNRNTEDKPAQTGSFPQINSDLLAGLMQNPQLLSLLGGAMNGNKDNQNHQTGLSKGNSLLSTDSLASVAKLMPLLSSVNSDDDTTRLLEALRPFLGTAKQKKLDEAKKMLRLLKILPLIKSKGIL